MVESPPSCNGGEIPDEGFILIRQTYGDNMLLEDNLAVHFDQRHVILEVRRLILGMHLLPFNIEVLVGKLLVLFPHVPLPEANLHAADRRPGEDGKISIMPY